jgi:hypothetical protein
MAKKAKEIISFLCFETGSHYVPQDDFELVIQLPQPQGYRDYRQSISFLTIIWNLQLPLLPQVMDQFNTS